MEVRLLEKGYKNNEQFYKDFLDDTIRYKDEYFSGEVVTLPEAPDFPIYMAKLSEEERKRQFLEAFEIITDSYLQTPRDLHFDELFWHSLLTVHKRGFLLETYPQIGEGISHFNNIVIKKFDWENYIYKCVIGAQYINDATQDDHDRKQYYHLLIDNLDLYNYIIKYEIFRNQQFLINVLDIIDELNLSKVMKGKIKGRDDLGKDERVGRRIIFEFNKSYPVIMSPILEKDELKELFIEYLGYYYEVSRLNVHEPV
ncbi:hypothetical protein [Fredinandcohnia onubensis]|uniref:hypothetical protein n=1 Tax=Fredinandcohnia onubensis TaxID=1571209 RepID=UPI000C0BE31A|nr:hypothetical protein [Fredinandcohnia onubensis]